MAFALDDIDTFDVGDPGIPVLTIDTDYIGAIPAPNFNFEFTATPPTPSAGEAPELEYPDVPSNPPALVIPSTPTIDSILIPAAPADVGAVDLPDLDAVEFPTLSEAAASIEVAFPITQNFQWAENAYSTELIESLYTKLINDVQNGGYGIDPNDEAKLWTRATERDEVQAANAVQNAVDEYAALGYMMPPGTLLSATTKLRSAAVAATSALARDVALKRSELYVENRKHAIQQAKELEKMRWDIANAQVERLFNARKEEAAIYARNYTLYLDAVKTKFAGVETTLKAFEANLRKVSSVLEKYKVQLEGTKISADVDRIRIDSYKALMEGTKIATDVQRLKVEITNSLISIEKAKMEMYKVQVEAYTARVGAESTKMQAYEAKVKGDVAASQAYEAQAKAYATRVDAEKAKISASKTEFEVFQAEKQLEIEAFKSKLAAAELRLKQISTSESNSLEANKILQAVYGVDTGAATDAAKLAAGEVIEARKDATQNIQITEGARVANQSNTTTLAGQTNQYNIAKLETDAKIAIAKANAATSLVATIASA